MIYQIICSQNRRHLFQELKNFYIRRFYRLAPALIVTLLGSIVILILFASSSDLKKSGLQALYTIGFLGNVGAFRLAGDYFHNNGNPLIHTWSLSIEEQIYFGLPVIFALLYLVWNKINKKFYFVIFALFLLSFFAWIDVINTGLLYTRLGIRDVVSFGFYSPIERFWQFGLGGMIHGLWLKYSEFLIYESRKIYIMSLTCLVVFVAQINLGNDQANTLVVMIIMSGLLLCIPSFSFESTIPKTLVGIGNRAYSVYLVHMPIVYLMSTSPYLDSNSPRVQSFLLFAGLAITFLLAEVLFRNVETRFRLNGQSEKNSLRNRNIFLFGAAGFLFGVVSFTVLGGSNSYFGLQKNLPHVDVAWAMDPDCARMTAWDGPPCSYPVDGGKKTLLLIGDSHAAQLSEVVLAAGHAENWNVVIWTMPGCAVVFVKTTSQISNDCLTHNLRMLSWINLQKPNLVIISQYNGAFLPQGEIRSAALKIKSLGPRVHLVGNTPVFSDKRFMTYPALFQKPYKFESKVSLVEMDWTNLKVSNTFLKWGEGNGMTTSDLNPVWCNSFHCKRKHGANLLFSDRDHLSVEGASQAYSVFQKILSTKVPGPNQNLNKAVPKEFSK